MRLVAIAALVLAVTSCSASDGPDEKGLARWADSADELCGTFKTQQEPYLGRPISESDLAELQAAATRTFETIRDLPRPRGYEDQIEAVTQAVLRGIETEDGVSQDDVVVVDALDELGASDCATMLRP